MKKKRIGIIGYSGAIGRFVVDYLSSYYNIRGGSRHASLEHDIRISEKMEIDIYNDTDLQGFCAGCDLIINCAGPTYLINDRVIKQVAKEKIPYIDAFGGNLLESAIFDNGYQNDSTIVISAGVFPGLSGILLKWIARDVFSKINRIVAYSGGQEKCSWPATMDLLLSSKNNFGVSNSKIQGGEVLKNIEKKSNPIELPSINQKIYVQDFISSETARIAKETNISELEWYTMLPDKIIYDNLVKAYGKILYEKDIKKIFKVANDLTQIYSMYANEGNQWYTLLFDVYGRIEDQASGKRIIIKSANSARLSALVISSLAHVILSKGIAKGFYWPDNLLNGKEILKELEKYPVIGSFQIVDILPEYQNHNTYEEGVL